MTPHGTLRRWIAVIAVSLSVLVFAAVAPAALAAGGFGPLSGPSGCLIATGQSGEGSCGEGKGLAAASAVAVSPDGANVYVVGGTPGTNPAASFGDLAILARNPATGAISETGCMSSDGTDGHDGASGACTPTPSLLGADGVEVSADGLTVFVASGSSASVVAFARDANNGSLTRLGCLQSSPRPGTPCRAANVFIGSGPLVASSDDTALYVASPFAGAVSALAGVSTPPTVAGSSTTAAPKPTAASIFLTPPLPAFLANPCIAVNGLDGPCAVGTAVQGLAALALSPDGKQLYGVAPTSKAIDTFALGAEGAISESGCLMVQAPAGLCHRSTQMRSPTSLALSPDGKNAYASDSGEGGGRIDVLARDAVTGALADAGCVDFLPPETHAEPSGEPEEEEKEKEKEAKPPPPPPDECERVAGLDGVSTLAVSGDGTAVYAFGSSSAAIFARDAATGKLTQRSCAVSEDSRCTSLPSLKGVNAVAVSPDGREVYVVAGSHELMVYSIGAAVTSARVAASHAGSARVRVSCPTGLARACSGRVELTRALRRVLRRGRHRTHHTTRVKVGYSARFSIAPGHTALVRVRLFGAERRLLLSRHHVRLTALVRADPSAGGSGYGRHLLLELGRS